MAAAALVAALLFLLLPLPSRPATMASAGVVEAAGAFHIHTNRSDGSGTPDEVAAAAARAGLQFVVLTDHGDGTRIPDPPQYRSGVLVIDAVELATARGHYIAMGLPQAPYPLRGEPRDVIEDVKRLGGFGVVAHPHSPRGALEWRDWNEPFDAIEWLNMDTEWRDERTWTLTRSLLRYPFRPAETLASLLDRPDATLSRWDMLTERRPVVGLAGVDAHARAGDTDEERNGGNRWPLAIPSYQSSFRAFAIRIPMPRRPALSVDPLTAAAEILGALLAGRVYSGIDALASPAAFEFTATSGNKTVRQGEFLESSGDAVTFLARAHGTVPGIIVLRKDGKILSQQPFPELRFEAKPGRGTYRVEAYLADAPGDPPVPWIVTNPVYVQPAGWGSDDASTRVRSERPVEHSRRTLARGEQRVIQRTSHADRSSRGPGPVCLPLVVGWKGSPVLGHGHPGGECPHQLHAPGVPGQRNGSHAGLDAGSTSAYRRSVGAIHLPRGDSSGFHDSVVDVRPGSRDRATLRSESGRYGLIRCRYAEHKAWQFWGGHDRQHANRPLSRGG